MTNVNLNDKEQKAADAILGAMNAIAELSCEDGLRPANFTNEVVPAIHTLQMFVLMHWAQRIHPEYWSDWFWQEGPPPWIPGLDRVSDEESANKVTPI